jgi:translocation and assembly module TamB
VAATPVRTAFSLCLPMLGVLLLAAALLAAAAGAVRWLLVDERGSNWLLKQLPMVQVQGFQGALLGDSWRAQKLRVQWAGGQQWVLIEDLKAEGLAWRWRPTEHAWLGLQVQNLQAAKLTLATGPAGPRPIVLPQDFAPPLQVSVAQTRAAQFQLDELEPWHVVEIDGFELDPTPGGAVSGQRVAFETRGLAIAGALKLGHAAPLPLTANATVRPLIDGDAPRWAAVVAASGSLEKLQLAATLRGVPVPVPQPVPPANTRTVNRKTAAAVPRMAPELDVTATLTPLQAWVLAGLNLRTQSLDLAALWPTAPSTRLSGQAELSGGGQVAGKVTPLAVVVNLENALPGRWNEGRLPVQRLQMDARSELAKPDRLEVKHFDLALADATRTAGHVTGSALWLANELKLDTVLRDLAPQRLDSRAPGMTLAGPLAVNLRGLPSPDFQTANPSPLPPRSLRWKLDLQGQLDAAPHPVQLQLEGELDDEHVALTTARAKSGAAIADLRAALSRLPAGNGWKLETVGKLLDFDPVVWLPGDAGTTWRKGPHRLSGEWQLDARLPARPEALQKVTLLQQLAGNGKLSIRDSVLAGVPLTADIVLGYSQAAARSPATPGGTSAGSMRAELNLGGNEITFDGRGDPTGNGANDRLRIDLKADNLASWAPLAKLHPALADWLPRKGSAEATLGLQGRWPALQTEGSAKLSQLQMGTLSLARGTATWKLDVRGDNRAEQPLSLQLDLIGTQMKKQRADSLHASLKGTLADHQIEVTGALPLVPPAMAEQMLGIQVQSGTRVQMQAQGAWRAEAAGGGRWAARIAQLQVGSWDGSPEAASSASSWADARDLRAEVRFDGQGDIVSLQADPGRVKFSGAATLRWDAVRVDLKGPNGDQPDAPPLVQLRADIEPFLLAPLLARAQPGMGWQGDLRLAARLDIKAGERVDADLVFERREGDLHAASGDGVQLLGLTEFKLQLAAHDGIWNFTQNIRGRTLGQITGEVRVQSTPERRWPQPEAPISGQVQLNVSDVGIWGAWVPPGWRLVGEVHGAAALGGTFGAPQYTGNLAGSGLGLRNLLEGVNVTDGRFAVKLAGDSAEIESFTLKGGDGSLNITGKASLGSSFEPQLQLQAERFRVLGRVDRQMTVSGKAQVTLLPEQVKVEGQVRIDEGLYDTARSGAPTLDEDVSVRRTSRSEATAEAAEPPKPHRDFALNLLLDAGDKFRVRGRGLDTTLRGDVRLTTPGGKLAVNGTISTDSGTYAAYGQKLEIERGIIAFSGSPDNPRLDVLALRPNLDTRVGVAISGNLLTLRIKLFSEPELSDSDKLAWLVLGRAPDGLGRNDTALLQRAAVALLSGEGEAPTDALLKSLGIDDIGLRQSDTDVRETVITVGKQLTRRWYLGYERGVNATTGTWQLIYRIAQRFTLRLQSGSDNSADVIWTWRLQETAPDAATRKVTVTPR